MPFFSPLSLNKKYFLIYFPLSVSIDIQLKVFVFVVVKMLILYNDNEYAVRTC